MHLQASGEGALAPINVIYVGPLDGRHRVHALADAFMAAREHDPRLHLLVSATAASAHASSAGSARPPRSSSARGAQLDQLTAHADLLVCPTTAPDTAQTIRTPSGAAYRCWQLTVATPRALIENGRSGFLVPDDAAALADAIRWLCRRATLRERLATGGRLAAGARHASGRGRIMTA